MRSTYLFAGALLATMGCTTLSLSHASTIETISASRIMAEAFVPSLQSLEMAAPDDEKTSSPNADDIPFEIAKRGRKRGRDRDRDRRYKDNDYRDDRGKNTSGSGRKKPRIPGGSGCDDPGDLLEHPECRG